MDKVEKEMLKHFGGVATEIVFTNPKKILWQDDNMNQLLENVDSIIVSKIAGITSIDVRYKTEEGNGSMSTAIQNIEKLVVMD
jgi:hypothetical protein